MASSMHFDLLSMKWSSHHCLIGCFKYGFHVSLRLFMIYYTRTKYFSKYNKPELRDTVCFWFSLREKQMYTMMCLFMNIVALKWNPSKLSVFVVSVLVSFSLV